MPLLAKISLAISVFLLSSSAFRVKKRKYVVDWWCTYKEVRGSSRSFASKKIFTDEGEYCPVSVQGYHCGCRLGCACSVSQSCYTNGWIYEYSDHTKRLGVCDVACWLLASLAAITVLFFYLLFSKLM
eukprot:TRINITY_DN19652_c0_g1_i1.p1 TRINITY_DN19652_c0_g1~~TRINITY_DN19652_c0_g1_i1.p1  ORF type:complete len:128 (-),score=12.08 TRINITY_DN19652_c0_g1_i1:94-477(-)